MTPSTAQPVMESTTNYTTSEMIISFRRSSSGLYTCGARLTSLPANTYISDSETVRHSVIVTTGKIKFNVFGNIPLSKIIFPGVYLALRDEHIANNSYINTRNIGQTSDDPNGALQCITDRMMCCSQNPRRGEWYLPNGSLVQGTASSVSFYRNRGGNGEVFLNRPSGVESPTGLFCCEVPDDTNTNQTLCVNIGKSIIQLIFCIIHSIIIRSVHHGLWLSYCW